MNTCTDMIVSVNKMQCFDKVRGGDGRRITTGQDAKAVSNHLMEVMAGRNKSMTNSLLPGNANHTLSHSVYSEDWGRDKERSQRASFCEEWGIFG